MIVPKTVNQIWKVIKHRVASFLQTLRNISQTRVRWRPQANNLAFADVRGALWAHFMTKVYLNTDQTWSMFFNMPWASSEYYPDEHLVRVCGQNPDTQTSRTLVRADKHLSFFSFLKLGRIIICWITVSRVTARWTNIIRKNVVVEVVLKQLLAVELMF